MADNVRGITIEINGETSPLKKALTEINKTGKDLSNELYQVNKQLKFDPNNTILLAQKQKLLADSVEETKNKLNILKTTEQGVREEFAKGNISEDQYRALQREVVKTEGVLKNLEKQAREANGALSSDKAISNLKNMGTAVAATGAAVGVAFIAIGAQAVQAADEIQKQSDVTGISVERLQELQYVGNNLGVDLGTLTGAQAKLTKSMNDARDGTGNQAEAFKALGISVTNSDGSLRNSQDVMAEAIDALGKMTNETERDAMAQQIFGKSAMELNPIIKAGGEEIAKLSQEARDNGAVMSEEAVDGLDAFGDSIDSAKQSVMGIVGEALAKMMPYITDLIKSLIELPTWIEENKLWLEILAATILVFVAALIAYNIAAAWGTIVTTSLAFASATLAGAIAFITSPVTLVVLAIGALIAIGVLLWQNWDTVKIKAQEIFGSIGTFVGGIIDGLKNGFKTMVNAVINSLNFLIRGLNKLKFDVPDWVPLLGGKTFGFNIPTIPSFAIGTKYLPQDMLIQAHEGEAIIPKKDNPYANSNGNYNLMPNMDELAIAIRRELEKAQLIAVVSRSSFDRAADDWLMHST